MVNAKIWVQQMLNNNENRHYDFMWESHLNQAGRLLFEWPVLR